MPVSAYSPVSSSMRCSCRLTARRTAPLAELSTFYCSGEVKLSSDFDVMCLCMSDFFNAGTHVANLHIRMKAFTNDLFMLKGASFKKTLACKSETLLVPSRLGVC